MLIFLLDLDDDDDAENAEIPTARTVTVYLQGLYKDEVRDLQVAITRPKIKTVTSTEPVAAPVTLSPVKVSSLDDESEEWEKVYEEAEEAVESEESEKEQTDEEEEEETKSKKQKQKTKKKQKRNQKPAKTKKAQKQTRSTNRLIANIPKRASKAASTSRAKTKHKPTTQTKQATNKKATKQSSNRRLLSEDEMEFELQEMAEQIDTAVRTGLSRSQATFMILFPSTSFHSVYSLPGRRRLLDTFGDSLRHVNRMFNIEYGNAIRKAPAHMPHFIQTNVLKEVQNKWKQEYEITSSNRFRASNDMQFAFTYFYHLMHHREPFNFQQVYNKEIDTNHDQRLDEQELKGVASKVMGATVSESQVRNG